MSRTLAAIALLALAAHTSAADAKLTVKVEDAPRRRNWPNPCGAS